MDMPAKTLIELQSNAAQARSYFKLVSANENEAESATDALIEKICERQHEDM